MVMGRVLQNTQAACPYQLTSPLLASRAVQNTWFFVALRAQRSLHGNLFDESLHRNTTYTSPEKSVQMLIVR